MMRSVRAGGIDRPLRTKSHPAGSLTSPARRAPVFVPALKPSASLVKTLYDLTAVQFPLTNQTQAGGVNTTLTACKTLPLLLFLLSVHFRTLKMKVLLDSDKISILYETHSQNKDKKMAPSDCSPSSLFLGIMKRILNDL